MKWLIFHFHMLALCYDGGKGLKSGVEKWSGSGRRQCILLVLAHVLFDIFTDFQWLFCSEVLCHAQHSNYTSLCVIMHLVVNVIVCVQIRAWIFEACYVWPAVCFQYSFLLTGDYLACIWLLSACDWKLERPGADWAERSENFLYPTFSLHPLPPMPLFSFIKHLYLSISSETLISYKVVGFHVYNKIVFYLCSVSLS